MGVRIGGFGACLDGFYDPSLQIQLNAYTRTARALGAGRAAKDGLRTPEDVRARQDLLRGYADEVLGRLPHGRPVPVATSTGVVHRAHFSIEKLALEVGAGRLVTAALYVPRDIVDPTGAVLFLCGHAREGKAAGLYQAFCSRLARNGLVVLAIDSIGQGERLSYVEPDGRETVPPNVVEHNHAGMQVWWTGDTIARYFVDDARRSIDYLSARPEVDPARIGVAGNSGGATQVTWLMLAEPRVAAAAPGCFIMSRSAHQWSGDAQDAEQILPGGALAGIDHDDFLIAMAPRPVLVMSANYDFFPIDGAVDTVERARHAYKILGHPDRLDHARADQPHGLSPELAEAATDFFVHHLGNPSGAAIDHTAPEILPETDLQCTVSGQVRIDVPEVRQVFELNLERFRQQRSARSERSAQWLTDRVHAHRSTPAEFFPRWLPPQPHRVGSVDLVSRKVFWWSETDILNAGVHVRPAAEPAAAVEIAVFDTGTSELGDRTDWLADRAEAGVAVLALDVRGVGSLTPHPINTFPLEENYGTVYKLMTDLVGLGDSLAAARVFDVLRAVRFALEDKQIGAEAPTVRVFGAGAGAFLSYVAAAIETRIARIELESPPLDPEAVVTTRLHGPQRDWQHLIPGMAVHCSMTDLLPNLQGRDLRIHTPQP